MYESSHAAAGRGMFDVMHLVSSRALHQDARMPMTTTATPQARRRLPRVTYRVYRTGHCATCVPAELEEAMAWWLSHPR